MNKVCQNVAPFISHSKNNIKHYNNTMNWILNPNLPLVLPSINVETKRKRGIYATIAAGIFNLA